LVCVVQVDALGRQLARGAADGQEVAAARENLLGELASAQQVRLLLERNREDLQRQLAVSEGQLGLLQEHLAEARQEIDGLRQRISLEQGRTAGVNLR
jgi:chromosome segregation ATPase